MRNHIAILSITMLFIVGCGKADDRQAQKDSTSTSAQASGETAKSSSGNGVGVVTHIPDDKKMVYLSHNDIPGIMEAMTMPYQVSSPDLLKEIKEGDSVDFTLTKTSLGDFVVTAIKKK